MKAIQYRTFGGPEVLEYVELPDPEPGPGDVLIETSAIGVNFPDIRERLGVYSRVETRVGGVTLPQVVAAGVAPAIANAVFHATGKRIRGLPITIEKLL